MPKDTKPKIFPHRYHPQRTLMQTALEESISRNAHYVSYNPYRYSNPIFRAKGAFQSQEAKQNRLWLEDAIRRASGRHTLQRPKFDRLGCRGRTVYDADQPAPKCGQLYDYWQRPPRHSSAESSSSSCSEVKQPRKKVRAVKLERRGSLTDETIPQASYAIFLRPLSPQFDLDIFGGGQTTYDRKLDEDVPSTEITPDIIEDEPLQNPLTCSRSNTYVPIDTGYRRKL
ncbi:hypothetical protein BDZ97DRAFT_2032848 [Flammula alnicola]|nr:hypothetical protein BDZ97DRAFT_2032848 [Flammula alnicola]